MEKTARRPSTDPVQERLRQNKALWNKEVSTFINDLIHFKKTMNGWPSKFFKERSRITSPVPADPATIIGSLAGDFQELVNKGNAVIQEQLDYSKNRRQRQPKQLNLPLPEPGKPPPTPESPKPPEGPDLSKQLSLGLNASAKELEIIKLAFEMEDKYLLESQASNPVTRFLARLFNPKFGFGEAARMRRLRMTLLDSCANTFKVLKSLQANIVKVGKAPIKESHTMMTSAWSNWSIVYRLVTNFKRIRPGGIKDPGGIIDDPELKRQKAIDEGQDPDDAPQQGHLPDTSNAPLLAIIQDYQMNAGYIGTTTKNPQFGALTSAMERLIALPKNKRTAKVISNFEIIYNTAVNATNQELGTKGQSFQEIVQQHQSNPKKEAQELIGGLRSLVHKGLPGATSGSKLEIYEAIGSVKQDINKLMNLLESGYDHTQIDPLVQQINSKMSLLRTTIRSLLISVDPKAAPSPFF